MQTGDFILRPCEPEQLRTQDTPYQTRGLSKDILPEKQPGTLRKTEQFLQGEEGPLQAGPRAQEVL